MSVDMIAIQVNPQTFDRIMAVASFVWPNLTLAELKQSYEETQLFGTYYFVPLYLGKFEKPDAERHPVLIREDHLKEDFDFEMPDQNAPFNIVRKY